MPLRSGAELAAFAAAIDGTSLAAMPRYRKLSALLAWDALIECAVDAGAITRQRGRKLRRIDWREDFSALVGPADELILNAAAMRSVPAGAVIAFIEVGRADAFHRSEAARTGTRPQGRRHIIHAMLSLGDGLAAGNKNSGIGIGEPVGWQVLDLAGSLNWLNDQPLDAVNAVPLGINVFRPIRMRYRELEEFQTPDVIEPRVAADLARLRALHEGAEAGSILALVLGDVIEASAQISEADDWTEVVLPSHIMSVENAGHAVPVYDRDSGEAKTYRLYYVWGNLGSLVHELTHVATNEDYRRDFINHETATPASMPAPTYNELGVRINELDRQQQWKRAWENDGSGSLAAASAELRELSNLLETLDATSELGQRKRLVVDKLKYGMSKVEVEHDTVLNQILVWIHVDWQLAAAPHAKDFVTKLESACSRSRERRVAARSALPVPPPPPLPLG